MRRSIGARLLFFAIAGCVGSPDDPVDDRCGEATPYLNWENFGHGFLTTYCQGCHGSLTPDRREAPPNVVFDTEVDARQWSDRILVRAATATPTMPPSGGPTASERQKLDIWLTCFPQ